MKTWTVLLLAPTLLWTGCDDGSGPTQRYKECQEDPSAHEDCDEQLGTVDDTADSGSDDGTTGSGECGCSDAIFEAGYECPPDFGQVECEACLEYNGLSPDAALNNGQVLFCESGCGVNITCP